MVPAVERLSPITQTLLDALPHPAMIVNRERQILSANSDAIDAGAVVGGYCWQTFGHSAYLSDEHKALCTETPSAPGIQCSFCRADQCLGNQLKENDPAVQAFGKTLDTYWIAINRETYLHYAIDVSGHTETKNARDRAEEKLRLILDSTAEGIYGLDPQGRCTFCNQRSIDLLGYRSEQELVGRNMHELIHHTTTDGSPVPSEDCLISQVLFSEKEHVHIPETLIWKADGTNFPAECWSHRMKRDDQVVGAVVTFVDISERKQQQQALLDKQYYLSKAQDLGKIGTWELNLEKNILKWTPQNHEIFGVPLDTPMDYELFLQCVHPQDREFVEQKWQAALKGEPYDIEHRVLVHGRVKWVREKAEIHFDSVGKPLSAIGFTQDITERKLAEEEKTQLIERLQEKSAEQERFVYTVSHDLKSPLVTVAGFLGILENNFEEGDAENFRSSAAIVRQAVKRMRDLLDELLLLSKIGKKQLNIERISLAELASQALNSVFGALNKISANVEIAPDLPDVNVDVTEFMHVLENLLTNAAKFSAEAEGGPHIKIGVRHDTDQPVYYVQDNGVGIHGEDLGRMFDLFERLNSGPEGSGIGLAIARRVVERHGGQMWAESAGPGQGATICFTLPGLA